MYVVFILVPSLRPDSDDVCLQRMYGPVVAIVHKGHSVHGGHLISL